MMLSYFKKVVTYVLQRGSDSPEDNPEEDEKAILNNIKRINFQDQEILEITPIQEPPVGQSESEGYELETFKFVHKTGKVTHLCKDYGLIDNVIYFERWRVSSALTLKVGDEVLYSAYRAKENETERVYRVYALKDDFLEFGNGSAQGSEVIKSEQTEDVKALSRVVTGRVTERRGREVYIESANIWCNLDKIKATYIPIEGDWVELQAVVTLDEEADNLSGEVLEVRSLKPLLTKTGCGRVTLWSNSRREGAIENSIYFTHIACESGVFPSLGDRVEYLAVESDQERFRWRALKVLRKHTSKSEPSSVTQNVENFSNTFIENVMSEEKSGIVISPAICTVEVGLDEVKTFSLEVTNVGDQKQFLKHANFCDSVEVSLARLVSPKEFNMYFLPRQTVTFHFECKGKLLGWFIKIFSLYFKDFVVIRAIEIKVIGNEEMNKHLSCGFGPAITVFTNKKAERRDEGIDYVLYGPRPWKPPKFLNKERKCIYNIPKRLWALSDNGKKAVNCKNTVLKYAPYLIERLNYAQYADRFHTLLYLEEMEIGVNLRRFDMKEVCLRKLDDYVVLEVPGLVEKRPSLRVGDKVCVVQPWLVDKVKHIGYIHEVRNKEILVKFNATFHDTYDESECDVYFELHTTFFARAHDAVNRARRVLGEQWLFPETVSEKPPQVDFLVSERECKLSENGANVLPKNQEKHIKPSFDLTNIESPFCVKVQRTLSWVNTSLNERQKLAVVNALRGQGRPLPYIIVGPPGTGKTVTLVEIAVQLYRLMPDSRILITTPSNSSADLITERLLEMYKFKPGQLVRLVAFYRVHENLVPPNLVPYSAYYNGRDDPKKEIQEGNLKNHIRSFSVTDLTGRPRITVSTCSAIAILHYQGLPTGHFSHILVDEAGQTSEPEILMSVTFQCVRTGQVILTGDCLQLGPVLCNALAKEFGLGISLMQRLSERFPYARDLKGFPETAGFDPRFIVTLNVNYRSVPEILSLPSQLFYKSDLIPTVSQTESEEAKIIETFNFRGENRKTPAAIVFHGIVGQNAKDSDSPSWFNPHEAWQVIFYLKKLYSLGLKSCDIGIVTPYAKQMQKLKQLLLQLDMSPPKVGSVEEFQGQERNVIIVSTVRSSPKHVPRDIKHSLGFIASPQRLNVVLTRARALLIIVGNPVLLSKDPYWFNVIQYCVKNNSYTGCDISDAAIKCNDTDTRSTLGCVNVK